MWVGWTLALYFAISFFVGLYLSDLRGFEGNGGTFENVAASVGSLAAAILLRIYWPALREHSSQWSEWTLQHQASTVALEAFGFGLLFLLFYRTLTAAGFGALLGAALGYYGLRREIRRRQQAD